MRFGKIFLFSFLTLWMWVQNLSSQPLKSPAPASIDSLVKSLVSRMTPEEKFWQLFMLAESWDQPKDRYLHGVFGFEGGEAEGRANGQMIDLAGSDGKDGQMSLAERINQAQHFFVEKTRLGIPMIPFGEALHGLVREGATSFPQSIGLAATFDTALMHRVAQAIARETRECGIRMVLSPVINIADDPRWGRTEETYGEDPWLSSAMGVAFVSAFEKAGIITNPKHFVANAGAGGRDSYPIHYNERMLREIYYPPFKACIQQGGSRSVMAAYNSLDGTPCTASEALLNQTLKRQWGFNGFVISDAGATGGSNCLHMTAKDYYESTVRAMNHGLDVIFQTDFNHYKLFQPPFLDGSIDPKAIDEAVTRVLRAKYQLGLFENPYVDVALAKSCFGRPEHLKLAREAAQKCIVLLKNDHDILPFSKQIKTLAVVGPDATEARLGGYSGPGYHKVSLLEGLKTRFPDTSSVRFAPGCGRTLCDYSTVPGMYLSHEEYGKVMPGLYGHYYNEIGFENDPVLKRIDPVIDFRWTLYSPDPRVNYDWFTVHWFGYLEFPESGDYEIGIEGNDGYRLTLDNKTLIDNRVKGSFRTTLKAFRAEKGKKYSIEIDFYETSGSVRFRLVWQKKETPQWKIANDKAISLARFCDAIIVMAGIEEGEGRDRADLRLPGHQEELILQLAALHKPIVVVLSGGSAINMNAWVSEVDALVDAWYPGEQGGNALADVLFGDYNPAGRLPITFPVSEGQLPLTYNHKPTGRNDDYLDMTGEALFPFGYGLSYTSFQYSQLKFDKSTMKATDSVKVTFTLKNTGRVAGEEVVQLYIKDLYASVARPVKELKGCQQVMLQPGESRELSFQITPEMLSMLDANLNEVVEPGTFRILIGASSKDIRLRGEVEVK